MSNRENSFKKIINQNPNLGDLLKFAQCGGGLGKRLVHREQEGVHRDVHMDVEELIPLA